MSEMYDTLLNKFKSVASSDDSLSMSKYMKYKFAFLGVKSKLRKEAYKDFLKEEKKKKFINYDFLKECFDSPYREMHYFVIDYLLALKREIHYEDIDKIMYFCKNNQWWDSIDVITSIFTEITKKDKRVHKLMEEMSKDDDIWIRRISLLYQLGLKENQDLDTLSIIIQNNLGSDEFFINKAIGWMLRDIRRCNNDFVDDFISKYSNRLSKLSIKESIIK